MNKKPQIMDMDDPNTLMKSVEVLEKGGVILYPTDTVYGLGADATNAEAVAKIKKIKGRSDAKSFLVMLPSVSALEVYGEVNSTARALAKKFLPGPLALIVQSKSDMLVAVQSEEGSVGFRVPNSSFCLALGELFQKPIVSTSANISGQIQPKSIKEILEQFGDHADTIDVCVDAGVSTSDTPSTIVEVRDSKIIVLREGAIPKKAFASSGILFI